jgi:hypothetical protein
MTKSTRSQFSVKEDFDSRDWSPLTPAKAFGVYGLSLHLNHPNPSSLISEAAYDDPDDKKIDFFWIDPDRRIAFVGQSYLAQVWGKKEGTCSTSERNH